MIDALFGSKTRVKLLHLFLNNPGQSYFVREITRKIDEQINSVRRELSNMLDVGIITSDSSDNKLYYQVNQRYDYYVPMRAIFGDDQVVTRTVPVSPGALLTDKYTSILEDVTGLRLAIFSGVLVQGSTVALDLLLVGNVAPARVKAVVQEIETGEGREINYCTLSYDEYYYRLSIRDRFITEIINSNHKVIIDKDNVMKKK